MNARFPVLALTAAVLAASSHAETVKDREAAVRKDRAVLENDARWIYNDFRAGFEKAKQTGKPLLIVIRCVPCLACAGIDAQVLEEKSLAPLMDQFVCVRVINANALDLSLFQFDYDLSFSAMFFNGDGTTYGRYGSWTHQRDPLDKTTAGFQRTLEGALAMHSGYPANKSSLAGKQGGPVPFKTPVEIPSLAARYKAELDWEGKVVQSCVHCHQVGDAFRTSYREQGKVVPEEWVFPFPQPETIGLTLAPDHMARIEAVAADSIAAAGGLRAADEMISLGGQPLISPADVSWALHRAPASGTLPAVVRRGSASVTLSITLPAGWRGKADISKRVGTWPLRAMALGGMILEDVSDEDRAKLGIATDRMALRAKGVGQFGKHAAAKNAGFLKDDILTALDGSSAQITESGLIGKLLMDHKPGERVKTTVLRGGKPIELFLPMQ